MLTADCWMTAQDIPAALEPDAGDMGARLGRDDARALGEAYDAHHGAVRAFAQRLLGDAALAEDLVHEVFIALPRAARRFRRRSSLRTFLIGIAINRARHYTRAAARRRAALERLAALPQSHALDPECGARQRELARLVSSALERLPFDQRVVFVLCEVEERTSREVARVVGVPEATVRTRLFQAKRKLREIMKGQGL